ncbi:DUF7266 family protein [Halorhabdus utahensis]|nr:hypothetical protein [Halorhabdus utahensis]
MTPRPERRKKCRTLSTDDRGVSRMISYMLTVGIAMVLITGLFTAGSAIVEDQQDQTARTQLSIVGQQVAGSVEVADQLVRSTAARPSQLVVTRSLPERIAGSGYRIEVSGGDTVILRLMGDDLAVSTHIDAETTVTGSAQGGTIEIVHQTSSGNLVIQNG